jgi:hypothetical protein
MLMSGTGSRSTPPPWRPADNAGIEAWQAAAARASVDSRERLDTVVEELAKESRRTKALLWIAGSTLAASVAAVVIALLH